MKKSMMVIAAGLGLLLTGCATQSPYVGTWQGEGEHEEYVLTIAEDGRFVVYEDSGKAVEAAGSWEVDDKGLLDFNLDGSSDEITGSLFSDNEMIITEEGGSAQKYIRK